MKIIVLNLISLIIYNLSCKLLKMLFIKKSKINFNKIINDSIKLFPLDFDKIDNNIDRDYWGNDIKKNDFEREKTKWI